MAKSSNPKGGFGTAPVLFTSLSTILGAILYLRMGYAVGNVGLIGTLAVIFVGHLVTLPAAMAIAEIATNQRVAGGGAYYIISRSFGLNIGAAIGIALFLSQAISVAFYIIAFTEAFTPVLHFLEQSYGIVLADTRLVSFPTMLLLSILMLTKGAAIGIKAVYFVAALLLVSLGLFFFGTPLEGAPQTFLGMNKTIDDPDPFFKVFAICFPAFTGIAAGLGLSGDLKNPFKSIPRGTLGATLAGMVIYALVAYKLSSSASATELAGDQLIMSRIAVWGPIIPIGLAAAALSSALGSILVAPRTLQAIAADNLFPGAALNSWLGRASGRNNEPVNAIIITCAIALVFIGAGDVNFVAEIISMFFMVTYGAICSISFLEHFAAEPAYRPTFRSRWYISLIGAVLCVWLMFKMSPFYSILSFGLMGVLFVLFSRFNPEKKGLSAIFQGAMFQFSRKLHVFLQKTDHGEVEERWRPSVACISDASFERHSALDLLRWLSDRYGFGTYIHYIEGYLSRSSYTEAQDCLERLVRKTQFSRSNVYIDTIVSPSYTAAVSQLIQRPDVSGKDSNLILFEYSRHTPQNLTTIIKHFQLVNAIASDICILASSERGFGYKGEIHIWLTPGDFKNSNLMILLAFIVQGHAEWKEAHIKVFALYPENRVEEARQELLNVARDGRLHIAAQHIKVIPRQKGTTKQELICQKSGEADLVLIGFSRERLKHQGEAIFEGYQGMGNILYVCAVEGKTIDQANLQELDEKDRTSLGSTVAPSEEILQEKEK